MDNLIYPYHILGVVNTNEQRHIMTKEKEKLEGNFKINDDEQPPTFSGKGFKMVIDAVKMPVDTEGDEPELMGSLNNERNVSEFFKNDDGYCLICELWCNKKNCTKCEVPKFSEKITTEVMRSITTHKDAHRNDSIPGLRKTMVIKKGVKED